MTQRTFHVAIIMDGNGRWAASRHLPRTAGHRAGADSVRRAVESAPALGIDLLTLYAFSSDNWKRPPAEVNALLRLFHRYLWSERNRCVESGIRLNVIGRRDRLPPRLVSLIEDTERQTAGCDRLRLRIAIDYSSRDAIARASSAAAPAADFRQRLAAAIHADAPVEDVDLLIRTGRERRLSDFLLFEAAYAELHFSDRMWPDFTGEDLAAAVDDFRQRNRRFGAVDAAIAAAGSAHA